MVMIGEIVHYVTGDSSDGKFKGQCLAAIITRVNDLEKGIVSLCVFTEMGLSFDQDVSYVATGMESGTWHDAIHMEKD